MKRIAFLILLLFLSLLLFAEKQPENNNTSNELFLQMSSLPEAKLGYIKRFEFPFLQGENPLTENNNIGLALSAEISPISINSLAEVVWTPIAFFQLAAGGRIGSGWNINLFGGDIYGIGINESGDAGKAEINGSAFDGLLWKTQLGAAIQFDFAAIVPGDWNHVIGRSYHEINYKGYTRAASGEAWYFEADEGENCNGFNYYGNFILGYQMPLFVNFVGLLAEMDLFLYDTPGRKNWGDDLIRWTFSGIVNFSVTKQFDISLLAQFRTCRKFIESNWEDLHYQNRTLDTSKSLGLEFYRVAAALTFKW